MNILVACEESQAVTIELRKLGHRAFSCDLFPCSGGHEEWHIQGDCIPLLNGDCTFKTSDSHTHTQIGRWDMIIAFPPCTFTTNAGAKHLWKGHKLNIQRYYQGMCGKALFETIRHADCERIAVENPTPSKIFEYPKATQAIQPYMFGEYATKRTCLWLKGLPQLEPSNVVVPPESRIITRKDGTIRRSCWEMDQGKPFGGEERAKERSKTFPGIARAMAEQWAGVANEV